MGLTHEASRVAFSALINSTIKYVNKDREKSLMKLVDLSERFMGDNYPKESYEGARSLIQDPDGKWMKYLNKALDEIHPNIIKTAALNLGFEAGLYSTKKIRKMREVHECNIPWAILIDPTSACNLRCKGCWAAEYGHKLSLSYDELDNIITQGNFTMSVSIDGSKEVNDERRGEGVYDKIMTGMEKLKEYGILFGTSVCYTSQNVYSVTSDDFLDMLIEKGSRFIWYFHYMPVGNDAAIDLLPTPEQREYMYHRVREIRGLEGGKPIFAIDFQNDGEYVGGCIAGGRNYLHINPNGDVEPCVFIHYSSANIKEVTLLEALKQPLFMAYRDNQPFNNNHLRPCPMLENPEYLRNMVKKCNAKSTDLQSLEEVDHLCDKCTLYAHNWADVADKLWEENKKDK